MRILLTRNTLHNMLFRQALESQFQKQSIDFEITILEAPLLEQVPIVDSVEHLLGFLDGVNVQDVIFISPSSVDFGAEKILKNIALERLFAVGKGTGNLLQTKLLKMSPQLDDKLTVIFPKTSTGSLALLKLPEMQTVNARQVLIVTGSEGKPNLEKELLQRGANVCRWECYKRQKPTVLAQQMREIFEQPLDYVFLHSAHAARHFLEEVPVRNELESLTAIVGAQTIADEFKKKSWPGVIRVAESPMPKDMQKAFGLSAGSI